VKKRKHVQEGTKMEKLFASSPAQEGERRARERW